MVFPEGRPPNDKVPGSLKGCEPQLWIVLALLVNPLYWLLVAHATVGLAVVESWSPPLQIHGQTKTEMSWGKNEPLLYGPQDYDCMGLCISGSWVIVSRALSPHRSLGLRPGAREDFGLLESKRSLVSINCQLDRI